MAVAQRNSWNVCNAEISSTQPFFSSSRGVQIHAAAVDRVQPQCKFQQGTATASLLRARVVIYVSATHPASCASSGASQHQKLPVLK